MKPGLRGLYLVTPDRADTAALVDACAAALRGAPALLQYRSKLADADLRREQALALRALCRRANVPLVVNDDLELALQIGADGVHLGRDDGDAAGARARLGADRLLGITCYNEWARAQQALAWQPDYLAFGAMFPSPSKPQAVRATPGLLTRASRELGLPVAAIGGITLDNAPPLVAAGASLLAVISDVFDGPDPEARVRAYRALFL